MKFCVIWYLGLKNPLFYGYEFEAIRSILEGSIF